MHLGREDDLVAAPLERLSHDLFGLAAGVGVGGVDEVDPGVQRLTDDADRVVVVGVADGPEHHRAERVGTDLDAGPAESAVVHAIFSWCVGPVRLPRCCNLARSGTLFRNYTEQSSVYANKGVP